MQDTKYHNQAIKYVTENARFHGHYHTVEYFDREYMAENTLVLIEQIEAAMEDRHQRVFSKNARDFIGQPLKSKGISIGDERLISYEGIIDKKIKMLTSFRERIEAQNKEIQELKAQLAIAQKTNEKVNGFTSKQRESITVDNDGLVYVNGIHVCDCNNDLCPWAEDYYCRAYCAYHSDEEDHNG